MTAAVVTVSDSVNAGTATDTSGAVAAAALEDLGFVVAESVVVADGVDSVAGVLTRLADQVSLIVTTGGTGLSPRDLTPEGTRSVIDREVQGISEAMRADTFGRVPFGMLSRGVSGLKGDCLIVNMPGSPKAVAEGFDVVGPVLIHAVDLASGGFGRHG
ncbi:MAG: MogA/MoaB family molybdenum cofactor biosynthesis protein [Actinobacteria bacterium]|nr:MAG: MogA/MoaB family molybdenum cofactor biosynthesis protein [Actinomycetota bacterium]